MENNKFGRLGSLDVLRGFDLFCLVFFQPVFRSFAMAMNWREDNWFVSQFEHVPWEGFVFWDIIMPLFMFMAGVSLPFAFAKHLRAESKIQLYKRVLKRVLLLWIFGMMCQGNLLAFDSARIFFFSNTLQAIAVGYLVSSVLMIHFGLKGQLIIVSGLLALYWAIMTFVKADGFGGGNFSPDYNLAEFIDRSVLGRFRDGVAITETGLNFGNYRYTWIISSLNFGVTVMTGAFAGQILKGGLQKIKKLQYLIIIGVSMIVAGQLWGIQMPIIKHIWTSSMTLFSSGICFLLMALFYFLVDYKDYGKYLNWLKIYGMNSILAYMLFEIVNFSSVSASVLHGMKQYTGDYYETLITFTNLSILFLILWKMYRKGKFLKV
ncbi:MAG: acyltransferase family protein [Mangrovibacterium sp.]